MVDIVGVMLLETVKRAIESNGKSRNQISRDTGIDPTILWRVTHGQGCSVETLDRLCVYLGLKLRQQKRKG
jgi:ribosome-binding protein aMBF1 (putative translation factor)